MTRTMTVDSITQDKSGTTYELRTVNPLPHHDDRLTLVVKYGDYDPEWRIGTVVTVEVN